MLINILKKLLPKKNKNGKWKEFNKHAILVNEGFYKDNLKHGPWKHYYETGELVIEESYQNGELHGQYVAYYINGERMSQGYYAHGMRQGYFHIYSEQGKLTRVILFVDDVSIEDVAIGEIEMSARQYGT